MRNRIADIIWDNCHDGENGQQLDVAADAIIAALPSMVAPLVWVEPDGFMSHSGLYQIAKTPFESHWRLFFGQECISFGPDKDILGIKANAHHVAQIMGAFATPEETA